MKAYRILFHGRFVETYTDDAQNRMRHQYSGFYTSRTVASSSEQGAIVLSTERIWQELDELGLNADGKGVQLEMEEICETSLEDEHFDDRGFTFYKDE